MSGDDPKLTSWLSLRQIAAQLESPFYLVRQIAESLEGRLTSARVAKGRRTVYAPGAVEAIRKRIERTGQRRKHASEEAATYWELLGSLRITAKALGRQASELMSLYERLRRNPPSVTAWIYTLPDPGLRLLGPLGVVVSPLRRLYWRAHWSEAGLSGDGRTQAEAVLALREEITQVYQALRKDPSIAPERWAVLDDLIEPRRGRRKTNQEPEGKASGLAGAASIERS